MKESVTYQAILAGEAQRFLLKIGAKHLGPPDAATRAAVGAIESAEELERLGERVLEVKTWEELLGLSPRVQRNGRRRRPSG